MEELEQGSDHVMRLSLRVADGHELASQLDGWRCLSLGMIKLLEMLFKRLCTHSEAEEACLVPPFPGDCCPAENGIAAGLGRKRFACCLGGYCFVPGFKAGMLHQITVLTLPYLQCLWKYEANVVKPACWSWGFSLALFFLGIEQMAAEFSLHQEFNTSYWKKRAAKLWRKGTYFPGIPCLTSAGNWSLYIISLQKTSWKLPDMWSLFPPVVYLKFIERVSDKITCSCTITEFPFNLLAGLSTLKTNNKI